MIALIMVPIYAAIWVKGHPPRHVGTAASPAAGPGSTTAAGTGSPENDPSIGRLMRFALRFRGPAAELPPAPVFFLPMLSQPIHFQPSGEDVPRFLLPVAASVFRRRPSVS